MKGVQPQFGITLRAITLFLLTFGLLPVWAADGAATDYGVTRGKPIDAGFIFFGNSYIEAPYVVERNGLNTTINGYQVSSVKQRSDWRIQVDPGKPPAGVMPWNEVVTRENRNESYWMRKWRYLNTAHNRQTAWRMMYDLFAGMQGVKEARWLNKEGGRILVVDENGNEKTVCLLGYVTNHKPGDKLYFFPLLRPSSKEDLVGIAEEWRITYEKSLTNNAAFFFTAGSEQYFGAGAALRAIEAILTADTDDPKARLQALKDGGIVVSGSWGDVFLNLKTTPQLETRYKRIKADYEKRKRQRKLAGAAKLVDIRSIERELASDVKLTQVKVTSAPTAVAQATSPSQTSAPPASSKPNPPAAVQVASDSSVSRRATIIAVAAIIALCIAGGVLVFRRKRA